ncbi:hypothetical protein H2198_008753 [Neophaeococcomyces mojaviensis]|uniref:Uncharacterized protein n=1 Tax=Neophaeococcomyces mojaviensis TaxID=3383035 RepID=A0ACC2ZWI4_9EURO|nr:hypothetical protein H2198_008753 [Knufia sp. JES_112]
MVCDYPNQQRFHRSSSVATELVSPSSNALPPLLPKEPSVNQFIAESPMSGARGGNADLEASQTNLLTQPGAEATFEHSRIGTATDPSRMPWDPTGEQTHASVAFNGPVSLPLPSGDVSRTAITLRNGEICEPTNTTIFDPNGAFDTGYWTPNAISSINWLPMSVPDNFYFDGFLDPTPFSDVGSYQQPTSPASNRTGSVNVAQSSVETPVTHSSTADSVDAENSIGGEYYIDGNGGRLPRIKRRKIINRRPSQIQIKEFRLDWSGRPHSDRPVTQNLTEDDYRILYDTFTRVCVSCAPVLEPFDNDGFPPKDTFDFMVDLYFKHVHPSFPFVHRPTISSVNPLRWQLFLAMACTSCWFLDEETSHMRAESMLEFLRRTIIFCEQMQTPEDLATICRSAQIKVLFLEAHIASKRSDMDRFAGRCMGELLSLLSKLRAYSDAYDRPRGASEQGNWPVWALDEERVRTVFLTWQFSLLRHMQVLSSPLVPASYVATLRLPSREDMFEAQSEDLWQTLTSKARPPTFTEGLEKLYIDKKLLPELDDLSHILLTYGVIQRTLDIENHVQQPLSRFEPSAEKRNSNELPAQPIWAPLSPLYTKWRNSACDCLDILHWQANAAIGMAGGLEPSKVLHLHFARVLMLVPLSDLLELAHFTCPGSNHSGAERPSSHRISVPKRNIQRWAIHDQYKARLAAIHAGVTFWHVRKYSTNAHYEPFAVLGATLTLWALSTFSRPKEEAASTRHDATGQEDVMDTCEIILIDRPTDDELVQQFVRQGHSMQVHMTNVNDLWSSGAPQKVLREGKKLLATLGAWAGETERAIKLLDGLVAKKF